MYGDIPKKITWDSAKCEWKVRRMGEEKLIPRIFNARPNEGERFFLRVLLLHTAGAMSFEDLRTVDGQVLDTFREACTARGLLQDDAEWINTMQEASAFQMPRRLRQLFV